MSKKKSRSGLGTMLAASGPEFCPERRGRIVKRGHGDPNQARFGVFGPPGGPSASPAANVHFFGRRGGLMWPCQATLGGGQATLWPAVGLSGHPLMGGGGFYCDRMVFVSTGWF